MVSKFVLAVCVLAIIGLALVPANATGHCTWHFQEDCIDSYLAIHATFELAGVHGNLCCTDHSTSPRECKTSMNKK